MKFLYPFLLPILIILSSCTSSRDTEQHTIKDSDALDSDEVVIDLDKSTKIIMQLLKKDDVSQFLVPDAINSPDTIDTLLKNFCPAEMAFEAEVLNFKGPSVILFYDPDDPQGQIVDSMFDELALSNRHGIKFVKVDVIKLFKLAELAHIEAAPTILIMYKRAEVGRIEKPDPLSFDVEIQQLFEKLKAAGP
jgi:hypothetical protein